MLVFIFKIINKYYQRTGSGRRELVTSFTRIEDYIPLAIPEVWIYKKGKLNIYQFDENSYLATDTSQIFPDFSVKEIIPRYINRAWEAGSSVALREFSQQFIIQK
ncbi:MAG: hypothetical protein QNJ55_18595 [Xenococcus sp. MO_188.B8]|nr:hypothetical protein [Xenococcus sp. MO_188.B8]